MSIGSQEHMESVTCPSPLLMFVACAQFAHILGIIFCTSFCIRCHRFCNLSTAHISCRCSLRNTLGPYTYGSLDTKAVPGCLLAGVRMIVLAFPSLTSSSQAPVVCCGTYALLPVRTISLRPPPYKDVHKPPNKDANTQANTKTYPVHLAPHLLFAYI